MRRSLCTWFSFPCKLIFQRIDLFLDPGIEHCFCHRILERFVLRKASDVADEVLPYFADIESDELDPYVVRRAPFGLELNGLCKSKFRKCSVGFSVS